jgi:hypothetical protein
MKIRATHVGHSHKYRMVESDARATQPASTP